MSLLNTTEKSPEEIYRFGTPAGNAVFRIRRVSKIYRMGEVEVHALRSVDLDLFEGELATTLGKFCIVIE